MLVVVEGKRVVVWYVHEGASSAIVLHLNSKHVQDFRAFTSNSSIQPQERFEHASGTGRRPMNRNGKDEEWCGRRSSDVLFVFNLETLVRYTTSFSRLMLLNVLVFVEALHTTISKKDC